MNELSKQIAQQIASDDPRPLVWYSFLFGILRELDQLATAEINPNHPKAYEETLEALRGSINGRLITGEWWEE